jgi:hypothetical protein
VHPAEQLEAIHAGHMEIGDEQIDLPPGSLHRAQGLAARAERAHVIVSPGEDPPDRTQDQIVVIDEEDPARDGRGVMGDLAKNTVDLNSRRRAP